MRREALQGAIVSLTLVFGLPVLRSFGPEETARLMVDAARHLDRDMLVLSGRFFRGSYMLVPSVDNLLFRKAVKNDLTGDYLKANFAL